MAFVRAAWDWSGLTTRASFAAAFGVWSVALGALATLPPGHVAKPAAYLLAAFAMLLFFGHARRRLRDAGLSGWLMWVFVVPVVSALAAIALIVFKGLPEHAPGRFSRMARLLVWLGALLMASRLLWEPFSIPAGSMKPTLLIGDVIVVTPLRRQPEHGDVVVFRHPVTHQTYIKRVVARAGETVGIRAGVPVIAGVPLAQAPLPPFAEPMRPQGPYRQRPRCANAPVAEGAVCLKDAMQETTFGGRRYTVLNISVQGTDTMAPVTVPRDHLFVMGDNRDNSSDSRIPQTTGGVGMVPLDNVMGHARWVVFNTGKASRLFRRIE